MTRSADQSLLDRHRKGEPASLMDQVATIDSIEELRGFWDAVAADGRLTTDLLAKIAERKAHLSK